MIDTATRPTQGAALSAAPPALVERHSNNFNFLRLLLASLVLLSHSPELIDGNRSREILTRIFGTLSFGELAVDGFFLLSGYLIVQSWAREPRLLPFLQKRVLRIYPAFVVCSLVCAFIVGPLASQSQSYFAALNLPKFLAKMMMLRSPSVPPVFQGLPYPDVNGAAWTIAYEFRCYLLVALVGLVGVARSTRGWLLLTACAVALSLVPQVVSNIAVPAGHLLIGTWPDALRLVPIFLVGGSFYILRKAIRYEKRWAGLAVLILVPCMFHKTTAQLALYTVGAYAFFWLAFAPIPALRRFGSYSDVSYGLYLYGWPTQMLLLWNFRSISPALLFLLTWPIALGCGALSWHLVEKPFLRLKPRPGAASAASAASAA